MKTSTFQVIFLFLSLLILVGCVQKSSKLTEKDIVVLSSEWSSKMGGFDNPKVIFYVNSETFERVTCYLHSTSKDGGFYKSSQAGLSVEQKGSYTIYGATMPSNESCTLKLCCDDDRFCIEKNLTGI